MPDAQGKPTDAELRAQIISALSSGNAKPSKAEDLEILRGPDGTPLGYRDLATGSYYPIPAPKVPTVDVTTPAETTWVDIAGPVQQGQTPQQQGHRIVDGQLVAIPGLTRAKPASDTSGAPQWIPDPKNPNQEIQVVYSGTTALPVSANGAVVSRPKKAEAGTGPSAVGGARWIPDPSNPANEIEVVTTLSPDGTPTNKPTGASRKAPAAAATAAGNVIWQDIPGQPGKQQGGTVVEGKFVPIPELVKDKDAKPVAVYGTGPTDRFRVVLDEKGQVVSKEPNDNYVGEKPTQLTPDLVAPNIPLLKPDGTIDWVPNQNRVPAGQAMYDLMEQLHVKVNDKTLSMADAKDLLTAAVNTANAITAQQTAANARDTTAANVAKTAIDAQTQGATTGAGLLNQRVSAGQGMLSSVLGLAGQRPMVGLPGNAGQMIMSDIQGLTAQLGGGQEVYDTAARLVKAADPQGGQSPMAQQAYGVIAQILDRYKNQNGQEHPAVTATQAANASQQQQAFVPPAAPVQPPVQPVIQPQPVAAGFQAPPAQVPGQNYGANIAYTGGVSPYAGAIPMPYTGGPPAMTPMPYAGGPPGSMIPMGSFTAPAPLTAGMVLGR